MRRLDTESFDKSRKSGGDRKKDALASIDPAATSNKGLKEANPI